MSVDELMQGDFLENASDGDEDKEDPSVDDGLSNEVYIIRLSVFWLHQHVNW